MSEQQVQEIELDIERAQEMVQTSDALNRLFDNADFKAVIREGYFKEEPARLVQLKAAPQMSAKEHQDAIINSLDGIGALQQYFNTIWYMAENAQIAIEEGNNALDELAEEGIAAAGGIQ